MWQSYDLISKMFIDPNNQKLVLDKGSPCPHHSIATSNKSIYFSFLHFFCIYSKNV